MPLKCRWRCSSGTQTSERLKIRKIAVKVPLEVFQRHSNVRKA